MRFIFNNEFIRSLRRLPLKFVLGKNYNLVLQSLSEMARDCHAGFENRNAIKLYASLRKIAESDVQKDIISIYGTPDEYFKGVSPHFNDIYNQHKRSADLASSLKYKMQNIEYMEKQMETMKYNIDKLFAIVQTLSHTGDE